MIRFAFLAALVASSSLASQPASAQEKLPTVAEIMDKFAEKRDRYGVERYKLEFERTFFDNGKETLDCRWASDFLIDWRTGKYRYSSWTACEGAYEIIKIFDGLKVKTQFRDVTKDGKPIGDGAWKYGLSTGRRGSWGGRTEWWAVFFHKGSVAGVNDYFNDGGLLLAADVKEFFIDGEITKDDRKCLLLKTHLQFSGNPPGSMQYEYLIDPKRDHSVVMMAYYRRGKLYYSFDIDVVEGKQPNQWVLNGWTLTFFATNGSAEQVIKVKVLDFAEETKNRGPNPFDIVHPEGAKVTRGHSTVVRDARGEWDFRNTRFEYEVKNGKLVQVSGPPSSPEWWLTDHWYQIARELTPRLGAIQVR